MLCGCVSLLKGAALRKMKRRSSLLKGAASDKEDEEKEVVSRCQTRVRSVGAFSISLSVLHKTAAGEV